MTDQQTTLTGDLVEPHKDPEHLRELYEDHDGDVGEIAKRCGCSKPTVWRYLRGFGITQPADGPACYQTREDGYEFWRVDQHTIYIHRLVAVADHGIEAVAGGHVHHKNGVRWDNRPENLQPLDGAAAHLREHTRPKPTDDQDEIGNYDSAPNDDLADDDQMTLDQF